MEQELKGRRQHLLVDVTCWVICPDVWKHLRSGVLIQFVIDLQFLEKEQTKWPQDIQFPMCWGYTQGAPLIMQEIQQPNCGR